MAKSRPLPWSLWPSGEESNSESTFDISLPRILDASLSPVVPGSKEIHHTTLSHVDNHTTFSHVDNHSNSVESQAFKLRRPRPEALNRSFENIRRRETGRKLIRSKDDGYLDQSGTRSADTSNDNIISTDQSESRISPPPAYEVVTGLPPPENSLKR